jgi:hypothetical protein
LKDTATISGVSTWFHTTAFRHFNLLEEAGCTGSGTPWNHKRDCQVQKTKLSSALCALHGEQTQPAGLGSAKATIGCRLWWLFSILD